MAKARFISVSQYIAAQPEAVQGLLKRVRANIRKALPGADEAVSYGIPAYKLQGRTVIYFAAWKKHFSLYPASRALVAAFKADLAPYEVEKGTIRFPLTRAAPSRLIGRIARFRAKECAQPKRSKAAAPKKGST
jgi:uncharacterized protein YdhG (YjbR/CyaY superfamily)